MATFHRSLKPFTSTRLLSCVKLCTPRLPTRDIFAHCGHGFRTSMTSFTIQVIINNRASISDFPHGTHLTTLVRLIRMFYDVNTHAVTFLQLLRGRHAFFEPALHYWKRFNTYWLFCAVPVEIKLPVSSVWVQESKWQYLLRPHLNAPWVHRLLRKVGFREHLVDFRRHSLSSPTSLGLHKRFRRRLHPDLQRQLRPDMLDDIQAHHSILYQLGSNTGASFQAMRDLLSAAFPPTQLYYFLRLSVFVNEPFRSKAQKLLAQVLRKRQLQSPTTLTQLLLPPLHVRNWKAHKAGLLLIVICFPPFSFQRSGWWKLAVPRWATRSTTTAHGSADGLLKHLFRVAVWTSMITIYTEHMDML